MKQDAVKGHLDMLLLAVLSSGSLHGYAIIEELRRRSDEAFSLPEGSVYPALHRLEDAGLITSTSDFMNGRRRRTYTLTGEGRRSLTHRRHEWSMFAGAVNAVLGGSA